MKGERLFEWRGAWPPEGMPHYVYRAYDSADRLLYIGCTSNPHVREVTHRRRSAWGTFAVRFEFAGPFSKSEGYRREREAIESEGAFFNATKAETAAAQANRIECRRRLALVGIPSDAYFDDTAAAAVMNAAAAEYVAAMNNMRRSIADTHPYLDDHDRMEQYLAAKSVAAS